MSRFFPAPSVLQKLVFVRQTLTKKTNDNKLIQLFKVEEHGSYFLFIWTNNYTDFKL